MSIRFICPHCKTTTLVDEQFANQSGPCAGCGFRVTITGEVIQKATHKLPVSPVFIVTLGIVLITFITSGSLILAYFYLQEKQLVNVITTAPVAFPRAKVAVTVAQTTVASAVASQDFTTNMQISRNNLYKLHRAMDSYRGAHSEAKYPPAIVTDEFGTPLYSWRVLLLPYLEGCEELAEKFDLNKAWNDPVNLPLSEQIIPVFHAPDDALSAPNAPSYVVFFGERLDSPTTMSFEFYSKNQALESLMIMETRGLQLSWAAPQDYNLQNTQYAYGTQESQIKSCYSVGNPILTTTGSVLVLPLSQPEILREIITQNPKTTTVFYEF